MQYIFESDYSSDFLRWIKKCEEKNFKPYVFDPEKVSSNLKELEQLHYEIIGSNDPALAYFCAHEFPYKIYRMQKVILDNQSAKYAFLFAQNIQHCDVNALQNVVVNSKKTKYICNFACFVRGANTKALEKLIIKSNNVKYAHMYLKHVKNCNVEKFKKIIMGSNKPRYLFELAKHCSSKEDIAKIEDLIIATKSFTYMRMFAEKIKLADIEKIEQAVLDTENTKEIKKFAGYVKKSKMKKFFVLL